MLLGPSDGRFGQVMVPFVRGQRMVPSRTEPVSDHSRLELEFLRPFSVSKNNEMADAPGFAPCTSKLPVCRSGHLMLPNFAVSASGWSQPAVHATEY
jgi:hypothetical protein